MKQLLFIAGVVAACVAHADLEETVTGTTEVGMLAITSTAKNTIVAVPYLELTGGDICVSNIVKTANLAIDDELYVFGGSRGSWTAWVLKEGTTGAKYWQSVGTCSIENGKPKAGTSPSPSDKTMVAGSAIWLTRANPSSNPFYVYGGYTNGVTTTVSANTMTLVANPTASTVAIADKFTPETGDKIWTLGDDETTMTRYIYGTKGGVTGWFSGNDRTAASVPSLPAGCGAWMQLKHDAEITW